MKNAILFEARSNYVGGTFLQAHGANYQHYPMRIVLPAARGTCAAGSSMELRDDTGAAVPASIAPLVHWPDGSVRAWDVTFPLTLEKATARHFSLQPAEAGPAPQPGGAWLDAPARYIVSVTLQDGTRLAQNIEFPEPAAPEHSGASIEEELPIALDHAGVPAFRGALVRRRWAFYPGADYQIRLINHLPGDATLVREVRVECTLPVQAPFTYGIEQQFHGDMPHPRLVHSATPFTVAADGGAVRVTDIAQLPENPLDYPDYERPTLTVVDNWTAVSDAQSTWQLIVPEARERFPKGWNIEGNRLCVDVHPTGDAPLEWRRGMAIFQRFQLVRHEGVASGEVLRNEALSWLRQPLPRIDADIFRAAGWRLPFRHDPARFPRTEHYIRRTYSFGWGLGTFNWGDEICGSLTERWASLSPDQRADAVWRNHEYDVVAGLAKEYARTGRGDVLRMHRNAAEHMMYTDFVAVSDDPWKEGGVPAHCSKHTSGSAYPSHMWTEGLTLNYLLTGDKYALQVARRIGDFFLKYIYDRPAIVIGTGREGGWTLIALAALYDVTREEKYLNGIRRIIDEYFKLPPHQFFVYEASFTVGVAIIGLDRCREFERDEEISRFILGVLDWQLENRTTPDGLFDYHFDAEREGSTYIQSKLPEALHVGYRLSGDEKFLRSAWRQYQAAHDGQLTVQSKGVFDSGYSIAYQLSWFSCLQTFADKGWLDALQYIEPPGAEFNQS